MWAGGGYSHLVGSSEAAAIGIKFVQCSKEGLNLGEQIYLRGIVIYSLAIHRSCKRGIPHG